MTRKKPKAYSACQHCGNPIPDKRPANAMYCSVECGRAVALSRAPSRAKEHATKTCEACGKNFVAARSDSPVCSKECKLTLRRMRRGYTADRLCERCGNKVPEDKAAGSKYCSPECRKAVAAYNYWHSDKGRAYRRKAQSTEKFLEWRRAYYSENAEKERARVKRYIQNVNSIAREEATRHGYEWTGPELEVADRREFTAREVAAILGRTVMAVENMRKKIDQDDPKIVRLLGRASNTYT